MWSGDSESCFLFSVDGFGWFAIFHGSSLRCTIFRVNSIFDRWFSREGERTKRESLIGDCELERKCVVFCHQLGLPCRSSIQLVRQGQHDFRVFAAPQSYAVRDRD